MVTGATLADAAVQAFLTTKDVVVLATVQPDGSPLAMPMWFIHDPDALTMISQAPSAKVRNLRKDARVSVVAEAGTRGDIRGVSVLGTAHFLEDSPERRSLVDRLHQKYAPHLERLWRGRAMPADRVLFRIVPRHVRTWGLG